ncbi:citryl-CoA lyase [Streptomyces scabiei]|uniref:citryl-CoA lyase n=1 Tax=Streptomyces scabiei TaxID=1930 RepID=UPI0036E9C5FA
MVRRPRRRRCTGRPHQHRRRVFEAVLAALADHGCTPTAIVTRLTYLSAPDSVQGALAAGLLGGGSRFLGVTEDTGAFLHEVIERHPGPLPDDEAGWDALALETVRAQRAAGRFVPGLGHHVHKDGDPRTPRLMEIAAEEKQIGPHLSLLAAIGRTNPQVLGKSLPLNGAGVCGAAPADLDLPIPLLRGFALLARTAGLIALRHPRYAERAAARRRPMHSRVPDTPLDDPAWLAVPGAYVVCAADRAVRPQPATPPICCLHSPFRRGRAERRSPVAAARIPAVPWLRPAPSAGARH